MKQAVIFCLLISAVFVPLTWLDYEHFPYSDGAEHGAALRELIVNIRSPGEPMLENSHGQSARYVPSLVLMAATARLAGTGAFSTIKLFNVVFFIFLLAAIVFFVREYFHDPGQAVWSLMCVLFLWGLGWTGANAYMFSALVYTAWFPSLVAFACALTSLGFACRFLRNGGPTSFAGWCLFAIIAFINHPLTAMFLWTGSFFLTIEIKGTRGIFQPWYAAVISLSIGVMALWPYYDFFSNALTVSGGTMADTWDYNLTRTYLYSDILLRTGPALVALPILCSYILKRKYPFLTLLCLASLCIYAAGYLLHISLAERFIFAVTFSAQIMASRFAYTLWKSTRQSTTIFLKKTYRALLILLIGYGIFGQVSLCFQEYLFPNFTVCSEFPYISYQDPNAMHKQFAYYMGPGDIVFSDVFTSWGLPLYTGAKIVSLYHTPPHVPDNRERKAAVERFFDPALDNHQRLQILRHFNATRLVVYFPLADPKTRKQIAAMGLPLMMQNDTAAVYKIPPDAIITAPAGTGIN